MAMLPVMGFPFLVSCPDGDCHRGHSVLLGWGGYAGGRLVLVGDGPGDVEGGEEGEHIRLEELHQQLEEVHHEGEDPGDAASDREHATAGEEVPAAGNKEHEDEVPGEHVPEEP